MELIAWWILMGIAVCVIGWSLFEMIWDKYEGYRRSVRCSLGIHGWGHTAPSRRCLRCGREEEWLWTEWVSREKGVSND